MAINKTINKRTNTHGAMRKYGWFYAKGRYSVLSQQKYSQIQEGE